MKIFTFLFAVANATLKENIRQWLLDGWWEGATETFNFASSDSTGFYKIVDGVGSKFINFIFIFQLICP